MKKLFFIIGCSMILMSCENVQEKCTSFNLAFDNAVSEDNLDKAEQIAKDARTYRSNLSESKQEAYDLYVEPYDAIIAAKKFNRRYLITTCSENYTLSAIKEEQMGSILDIKNEIATYRGTLKGKALDAFDDTVYDIEYKIVESKAFKQGWDYCMAFEAKDEQKKKQIEAAIYDSIAYTAPKYVECYKGNVRLAKLTYLNYLHNYVVNGTITESDFCILKAAILKE